MFKPALAVAAVLLLGAVAWPVTHGRARAAGKPLVVVVSASFAPKDIELATLRRAFSGHAADLAGKRLIPINHPNGSALRVAFDKQVLGLEAADVGKFWIDKRIRDEGSPPKSVPSVELAVRVAASLPGAITYALLEQLSPSVKVLTIDGKAPTSAGYPLSL
ncbi:MAG: hypothetical protein JWN04_3902 [Myxococcaceae bacterium]|nr:hypothetical protein [Myxococcaceae bacterium]